MAHKGKATFDIAYNLEDGPKVYNNPTVHSRLSEYTTMAKEVHGPEYDSRIEDIEMQMSSLGSEEARGMGSTGLPMGQSRVVLEILGGLGEILYGPF
jgi:hypothetical protein